MSNVFVVLQRSDDSWPVIETIVADNPLASVAHSPGAVKIDAPDRLTIRRESIEALTGRPYDLRQLQLILVTWSGHVDEDDDRLTLSWQH